VTKRVFFVCLLTVLSFWVSPTRAASDNRISSSAVVTRLVGAYNAMVVADGKDTVVVNGKTMKVDQGKSPATFDERLDQADLVDQLSIPYPKGCPVKAPSTNEDPGRLRYEPFFTAMYGGTAKAVSKNLTSVDWFGQKVPVTTVNGVDKRLAAVAAELAKLPELKKFLTPSGGTYNFRVIAGTKRLSVHSFGAAIDINTKYSDYWRWDGTGKPPVYRNRIPCEIAEVFEKHGFIWGAKWYHYDTMHFEYRPELINE
jgi:D-alanyl-D-alanine carboxypeptidase